MDANTKRAVCNIFDNAMKEYRIKYPSMMRDIPKRETSVVHREEVPDVASNLMTTFDSSDDNISEIKQKTNKESEEKDQAKKKKDANLDTSMESNAGSETKDLLSIILNDVKMLKKEMDDNRNAVAAAMSNMQEKMTEIMIGVVNKISTEMEVRFNDKIKTFQKQDDHIRTMEKEVYDQTEVMKRVVERANSVESALNESSEREKVLKRRVILTEANERKDNLMFFGIPEDEEKTCEETLGLFMKEKMDIKTPCFLHNSKRIGNKKDGVPRPIVTTFIDKKQRLVVWGNRFVVNKPFGVSEDLPPEIRKARTALVPQMKQLKLQGKRAFIAFPAILISDTIVIKRIDISEVVLD